MKKENSLTKFTEGELILLKSMARQFFETLELKKELLKEIPLERQSKMQKLQEQLEFAYAIMLENPNNMYEVSENPLAFGFGFIMMSINELGALDGEEAKDSIIDKINDFLMTVPEWVEFVKKIKKNNPDVN